VTPDDKAVAVLLVFMLAGVFSLFEYILKDTIATRWHPLIIWPWMLTFGLVIVLFIWSLPDA
jgi:hypothetical protein